MASTDIYCNTNNRLIYISDDINNCSIGAVCYNLLSIINDDDKQDEKEKNFTREPIKIYINSFGGELYDMWSLIDIILNSKTPIYTYCTGYAMSAAFKIFLAGHKRYATKHASFMYHQINCWYSGKYQDTVEYRKEIDKLQQQIEDYVTERTKITKEKIEEIRLEKKDFYIHSQEALELGIVDEII